MSCNIICQDDLSFQQRAAVASDVAEPGALDDEHTDGDVWMAHVDDRFQEVQNSSMLGLKFGLVEKL